MPETNIEHAHMRLDRHPADSWCILSLPKTLDDLRGAVTDNRVKFADVVLCDDTRCGVTEQRARRLDFLGQFGVRFAPPTR